MPPRTAGVNQSLPSEMMFAGLIHHGMLFCNLMTLSIIHSTENFKTKKCDREGCLGKKQKFVKENSGILRAHVFLHFIERI
jgi:hypothetical protein